MSERTRGGSIWEDGLGRRDEDARVLSEDMADLTPDPQAVRYGEGRAHVVVQAVVGGPVHRHRPYVDLLWHEGLRPVYSRLTPDEAERVAAMLAAAAERARREQTPG
ncbi:MAG: hypothetical protein AB7V42_02525 [Thermoleophilia bacterium]